MTSAADRGWGNPDSKNFKKNNITTLKAGGVTLQVNKRVVPLFKAFLSGLVQRGYRLDGRRDDWSYSNRDVRGHPGIKSNHSWGLAVDLNATTNPMTSDGRVHSDMPPWVPKLAAHFGLMWGGYYHGSRKDPMHFEFLGTPADADDLISRLYHHTTPSNMGSQDVKTSLVRPRGHGTLVKNAQGLLLAHGYILKLDGDYGPKTLAMVKDFQKKKRLVDDGTIDDKTWEALVNS